MYDWYEYYEFLSTYNEPSYDVCCASNEHETNHILQNYESEYAES